MLHGREDRRLQRKVFIICCFFFRFYLMSWTRCLEGLGSVLGSHSHVHLRTGSCVWPAFSPLVTAARHVKEYEMWCRTVGILWKCSNVKKYPIKTCCFYSLNIFRDIGYLISTLTILRDSNNITKQLRLKKWLWIYIYIYIYDRLAWDW